jgi:hypothetical protein
MPPSEPPKTVLEVEIEAFMTGARSALPGYDDAQILPGKGIVFTMHDTGRADAEVIDTYVLPWHAFDGCHMRRITREQYEQSLKDGATPKDRPDCFGNRTSCRVLCEVSEECRQYAEERSRVIPPEEHP